MHLSLILLDSYLVFKKMIALCFLFSCEKEFIMCLNIPTELMLLTKSHPEIDFTLF